MKNQRSPEKECGGSLKGWSKKEELPREREGLGVIYEGCLMSGEIRSIWPYGAVATHVASWRTLEMNKRSPRRVLWRLVYRHKLLSELQLDDLRHGCMSLKPGQSGSRSSNPASLATKKSRMPNSDRLGMLGDQLTVLEAQKHTRHLGEISQALALTRT